MAGRENVANIEGVEYMKYSLYLDLDAALKDFAGLRNLYIGDKKKLERIREQLLQYYHESSTKTFKDLK